MSEPVLYEQHMHTPLCKHARGEPEDYAAVAQRRGLKGIVVTCHNPTDDGWSPTVRMSADELDDYVALVERARVAWQGRVDVRVGMETDYIPGMEAWLEDLHGRADFNHVLGSVHPHLKDYKERFFAGDLDAFLELFPLRAVRIFGRGQANRDLLRQKAEGLGLAAADCGDPRDTIAGADIIVSSVPQAGGLEPFLETGWVKPGAYVNLIDLARTWRQDSLREFDRIIIEDAVQEAEMSPQMIPAELIGEDLLGLVTGRISGRTEDHHRIAFIFRGLAIGDLALAILVYQRALATGAGRSVPS